MNKTFSSAPSSDGKAIRNLYTTTPSNEKLTEATSNLVAFVELLVEMDQQCMTWQASKKARDIRTKSNEDDNQED